ncbi:unnamed protein product [Rhizophagus irregularis]|nr:unnamed protein product [Rhizophagus irregularis]CAB4480629.1 unnamed protein product [Rhizophagus irregularis]
MEKKRKSLEALEITETESNNKKHPSITCNYCSKTFENNENTNYYNSKSNYNSDSDNSTILEFESNVISLDDEE